MFNPIVNHGRKFGNNRWFQYSPKIKRQVNLYSDLEYENWVRIETDPEIVSFCEQPLRIQEFINGQKFDFIFDMWVKWRNGSTQFQEVKYAHELDPAHPKANQRSMKQVMQQTLWCDLKGYDFSVCTDNEIRANPILLANLKQLIPYLRHNHGRGIETDIHLVKRLITPRPLLLREILNQILLPNTRVLEAIAWLYVDGFLTANFDQKVLSLDTEVMKIEK